jgi:hypothetical protein
MLAGWSEGELGVTFSSDGSEMLRSRHPVFCVSLLSMVEIIFRLFRELFWFAFSLPLSAFSMFCILIGVGCTLPFYTIYTMVLVLCF